MPANKPSEIHALFLDAFNRGDVDALVALYEPSAVLTTTDGNAVGREAIRQAYQQLVAGEARMELETRAVVDSGEGLALLHAGWMYRRGETITQGVSSEVVRRQADGTWLFVLDEPRTSSVG